MDTTGLDHVRKEIKKAVVGQDHVVDLLLTCILANGHCLLTGVPGLAKTLLARSLASSLGLKFQRIQFTPDLMPLDILGNEILRAKGTEYELEWVHGPIFTHLLLADEINRATPRTQSALLQAMQEKEIHVLNRKFTLEPPFMVIATRNPLDQEGTFPLPEAQLDRFLMNIEVDYPTAQEEVQMLHLKGRPDATAIQTALSRNAILELQRAVYDITVSEDLLTRLVDLVRRTRPSLKDKERRVQWGAGPRAAEALLHAARAYAFLKGQKVLDWGHVEMMITPVLNHRIELVRHFGLEDKDEKETFLRGLST